MKSTTQTILVIGFLVAIVFGLTLVSNLTPPEKPKIEAPSISTEPPVRFGFLEAGYNPNDPFMKYFKPDWEVDEEGYFDFWFHNPNKVPVALYLKNKNCTCTGVKIGVIPKEAMDKYVAQSIFAGLPLMSLPTLSLPVAAVQLSETIKWDTFNMKDDDEKFIIPATTDIVPQMGVIHMTWKQKVLSDEKNPVRQIRAEIMAQLPGTTGVLRALSANIRVLPGINVITAKSGPGAVDFGEIEPNRFVTRELIVFSTTRSRMDVRTKIFGNAPSNPCFVVSDPIEFPLPEVRLWLKSLDPNFANAIDIRVAYRIYVTVYENRSIIVDGKMQNFQIDMGPFERSLDVWNAAGSAADKQTMFLKGIVRGDIAVFGGPDERDRVNLGRRIDPKQGITKQVEINSPNTDLELEVLPDLIVPGYMQAELSKPEVRDGKKRWVLTVTIPGGKLNGTIPFGSAILLRSKDASQRRIRIPVIGSSSSDSPF